MVNFARANLVTLKKTASYYLVHITVAAAVAYAVTGNLIMAFTLSMLEPTVQAVAFFCHEKSGNAWDTNHRPQSRAQPSRYKSRKSHALRLCLKVKSKRPIYVNCIH